VTRVVWLLAAGLVVVALAGVGTAAAQDETTANGTATNQTTTQTPSVAELSTAVATERAAVDAASANGGAVPSALVGLLAGAGGGLLAGTVVRYWGVGG
jgi:hypothetical protein